MTAAAQAAIDALPNADDPRRVDRSAQPARRAVQAAELLAGIIHDPVISDKKATSAVPFAAVDGEISARNQAAALVADLSGPVAVTDLAQQLPGPVSPDPGTPRHRRETLARHRTSRCPQMQVSDEWLDLSHRVPALMPTGLLWIFLGLPLCLLNAIRKCAYRRRAPLRRILESLIPTIGGIRCPIDSMPISS